MVGNVNRGVNAFKMDEVAFHLLAKCKVFIAMYCILAVGFCTLPMAVQPLLSSYARVAAFWGTLRSHNTLHTKREILPTLHATMNLASVVDKANMR